MNKRLEDTFKTFDQGEIFYEQWMCDDPVATLVVTHGLAEYTDCYQEFAEELNKENYNVFVWDLRGHGRSFGKRGYVADFDDYVKDHLSFIHHLKNQNLIVGPLVLFGHSMGGLITTKSVINNGDFGAKAMCLSSPALGVALAIPKLKETAARIAADWLPKITLFNEIDPEDLIRNESLIEFYKKDPLRHDKVSPRLFIGMLSSFDYVFEKVAKIKLPTLMQLAGEEKIVSTPRSKEFFEKLECPKEIFVYPESYHEIFNDLDKNQVYKDLKTFLKENVK